LLRRDHLADHVLTLCGREMTPTLFQDEDKVSKKTPTGELF
jgi:hypothetical protein